MFTIYCFGSQLLRISGETKVKAGFIPLLSGTHEINAHLKIRRMSKRIFHGKFLIAEKTPEEIIALVKIIGIVGIIHSHSSLDSGPEKSAQLKLIIKSEA